MDSVVAGVLHKQRCFPTPDVFSVSKGSCAYEHGRKLKWDDLKAVAYRRCIGRTSFSCLQGFVVRNWMSDGSTYQCEWRHQDIGIKKKNTLLRQQHFCPSASSDQAYESESEIICPKDPLLSIWKSFDAFYRFSRPHTVIGTTISIISVSLIAVESISDLSPLFVLGLLKAVVPAILMNIYIVGLNQLFDIEIDKVNKPNLPLASGDYSVQTGIRIVIASACLVFTRDYVFFMSTTGNSVLYVVEKSFLMGWAIGSWPLFWALFISFVLGTAYSINLPFLRWKQHAFIAASCILAVRAVIVQIAFYMHMQTFVFERPAIVTRPLLFATAFMSFFSVVIALFKDIPDIEGDRMFGIMSFSVSLGQKRVFWLCIYLLQMAYISAIVVGTTSPYFWSKLVTILGHVALSSILWYQAQFLNLKSKAAITSFYMFIWKLFYAEYLLIPLLR